MRAVTSDRAYERQDRRRYRESGESLTQEWPVQVISSPLIRGPFAIAGNPVLVEYEIVARLRLPAADTEVIPLISFCYSAEAGNYVDVQWVTRDCRVPGGIWERSTVIAVPRQFAIRVDDRTRTSLEKIKAAA